MKYNIRYEVDIDDEIQRLIEMIDDTMEDIIETWICDLSSRHYSKFIGSGMSNKLYEIMEEDIRKRAFRVVAKRWIENDD